MLENLLAAWMPLFFKRDVAHVLLLMAKVPQNVDLNRFKFMYHLYIHECMYMTPRWWLNHSSEKY